MGAMKDLADQNQDALTWAALVLDNDAEERRGLGGKTTRDYVKRLRATSKRLRQMAGQRWVRVSERLPDIGVSVLCSSPEPPGEDMVWIGQREQYEWYFPGANEMGTPTHWMPLPEPPEVK